MGGGEREREKQRETEVNWWMWELIKLIIKLRDETIKNWNTQELNSKKLECDGSKSEGLNGLISKIQRVNHY